METFTLAGGHEPVLGIGLTPHDLARLAEHVAVSGTILVDGQARRVLLVLLEAEAHIPPPSARQAG